MTAYDPEGTGKELLKQLEESSVWQSLPAVKNNKVYKLGYYDLMFDDPIATEHQVNLMLDLLLD